MQFDSVTRRVAGSIDVTISAALLERLGEMAGDPTSPEDLIDDHWPAIGSVVHRKVACGELEEDGSVRIYPADLEMDGADPGDAARIDDLADSVMAQAMAEAGIGRWFGDLPDDDIPW